MADLNYPDPSASPWTDPNGVVWEHNGIGWRKKSVSSVEHADTLNRDAVDSHPAAAISGLSLPNLLLNADFLILVHGGGNRTPGINVYGFSRWRGSAIGLKQTVEGASITSGNYTLSWGGGTGNGSLNGVVATSPITTVLASDVNADAEVPSDATWARLEIGDNVSPHVRRDIGEDIAKCHRYYVTELRCIGSGYAEGAGSTTSCAGSVFFPVQMRIPPSYPTPPISESVNTSGDLVVKSSTVLCILFNRDSTASGRTFFRANVNSLDAEIYD